jgi:hypothetical protein
MKSLIDHSRKQYVIYDTEHPVSLPVCSPLKTSLVAIALLEHLVEQGRNVVLKSYLRR